MPCAQLAIAETRSDAELRDVLAITWAPADPGASAVKSKESRSAGCT
jgi:hypothetical protein